MKQMLEKFNKKQYFNSQIIKNISYKVMRHAAELAESNMIANQYKTYGEK